MMTVKIIIMVFVIGGFLGALYRGIEKDNWIGFWHNFTLFVLFIIIITNKAFF